ncbi:UNVERIFIED_CONTAM: hypothetical protein H355_008140 [Colinus virginianus]|nr:hypothetical protein H355_008140 [Colinus virginianus]
MLVDDIGDMTITNDGATILKQLEYDYALRKAHRFFIFFVFGIALSLLHGAIADIRVSHGFFLRRGLRLLSLSCELFTNDKGDVKYPVSAINIIKTHGRSMRESQLVEGYALKAGRASQGMPQCVKNAKIALLDFTLRQHRMQLGVQIQVEQAGELEKIRQKEKDITAKKIEKILASGANVILTSQGIDDMSMKYFVAAGALAIRRVDKRDLRRIAKITGATVCLTLATLDGDEAFDPKNLGFCEEVAEERIGDWDHILFKGCKGGRAATIILRVRRVVSSA